MTPGKFRHLLRASTAAGHFVILALDHRANLLEALNRHAPQPLNDAAFTHFKQTLLHTLAPHASAILADPAYGIGPGIAGRALPPHAGLLSAIEITDYDLRPSARAVRFIPGWSVGKIKRVGGDGVKLLLAFHPEDADADVRRAAVRRLIDACGSADIPLYLEPIPYSLDESQPLSSVELTHLTVAIAREFSQMGADVLKLQFPADDESDEQTWMRACEAVTHACGDTPWALLSGGVPFDTFARQAQIACRSGACGIIAGRAVWNEAVALAGKARVEFLATTGVERLEKLAQICADDAVPIFERVRMAEPEPLWYEHYDDLCPSTNH